MPPIVAFAPGSTEKNTPSGRSLSSSCRRVTPAWTVTSMSSIDRRRIASMRLMSTDTPPRSAATWPSSDVPAPNGTIAAPCSAQTRTTRGGLLDVDAGRRRGPGGAGAWNDSSVPCWRRTSSPFRTRSGASAAASASPSALTSASARRRVSVGTLTPGSLSLTQRGARCPGRRSRAPRRTGTTRGAAGARRRSLSSSSRTTASHAWPSPAATRGRLGTERHVGHRIGHRDSLDRGAGREYPRSRPARRAVRRLARQDGPCAQDAAMCG